MTVVLFQACVQSFQKLFCTIVRTRIIADSAVAEMLFTQIHQEPVTSEAVKKIDGKGEKYGRVEVEKADGNRDSLEIRLLPLEHLSKDIVSAFTTAAQLLVDFSCFPMYCTDQQKVLKSTVKKGRL